jgi:hypothetical protein
MVKKGVITGGNGMAFFWSWLGGKIVLKEDEKRRLK